MTGIFCVISVSTTRRGKAEQRKTGQRKTEWRKAGDRMGEIKKEGGSIRAAGDVWIFAQAAKDGFHPVVYELLGEGGRLANQMGSRLCAVLIGPEESKGAEELIAFGADIVYLAHHRLLEGYSTDGYVKVLAALIEENHPSVFLFGGTDMGRDLAPRTAARIKTGLTVDCTAFKMDDNKGKLCMIRPAFGSRLMAEIHLKHRGVQMCTVRPGMFKRGNADMSRRGEILRVPVVLKNSEIHTRVIETFLEKESISDLQSARVIVAGGMGVGSKEGFDLLKQLANELHGAVGGTRAAAFAGFISHDHIIGQTGLIVAPDLYIACGISGAVQHMLGVSGAKCIVAVNNNPDAPIFEEADYGIAADYREFIPSFINFLKK